MRWLTASFLLFLPGICQAQGLGPYVSLHSSGSGTTASGIATAYSQIGAGNSSYGNSSSYSVNQYLANEQFVNGGIILHITCDNITAGSCSTPPQAMAVICHSGVCGTVGTAVTCNTTQDSPTTAASVAINSAWVAGDQIAIQLTRAGTSCNAPVFDFDLLVRTP